MSIEEAKRIRAYLESKKMAWCFVNGVIFDRDYLDAIINGGGEWKWI